MVFARWWGGEDKVGMPGVILEMIRLLGRVDRNYSNVDLPGGAADINSQITAHALLFEVELRYWEL